MEKPLDDFYGDRRSPDGRKSACKACHQEQGKASVRKHREKVNAKGLRWRKDNPEKVRAGQKRYYEENRVARLQASREWKEKHPARWREMQRAHQRNYKARKRSAPGAHTAADIALLYQKQRCRCVYCGIHLSAGYHVDHRMPLALHGSNDPGNLQLTCPTCNQKKRAKHPEVFAKELASIGG